MEYLVKTLMTNKIPISVYKKHVVIYKMILNNISPIFNWKYHILIFKYKISWYWKIERYVTQKNVSFSFTPSFILSL